MSIEKINENIARLIKLRAECHNNIQWQNIINMQLDKLYEFKYQILGGGI